MKKVFRCLLTSTLTKYVSMDEWQSQQISATPFKLRDIHTKRTLPLLSGNNGTPDVTI